MQTKLEKQHKALSRIHSKIRQLGYTRWLTLKGKVLLIEKQCQFANNIREKLGMSPISINYHYLAREILVVEKVFPEERCPQCDKLNPFDNGYFTCESCGAVYEEGF